MQDLSLHILDIVENSLAAGARRVEIRIEEDLRADRMTIEIVDDGCGMDEEMVQTGPRPLFYHQDHPAGGARAAALGGSLPDEQRATCVCNPAREKARRCKPLFNAATSTVSPWAIWATR